MDIFHPWTICKNHWFFVNGDWMDLWYGSTWDFSAQLFKAGWSWILQTDDCDFLQLILQISPDSSSRRFDEFTLLLAFAAASIVLVHIGVLAIHQTIDRITHIADNPDVLEFHRGTDQCQNQQSSASFRYVMKPLRRSIVRAFRSKWFIMSQMSWLWSS